MLECVCLDLPEGDHRGESYKTVTARQTHKCCECGDDIQIGNKFEYLIFYYDNPRPPERYKTCHICVAIGNDFFPCGYGVEGLYETFWEEYGYYPDEIPEDEEEL